METPFRKAKCASSCRTLTGVRRKLQYATSHRGKCTKSTKINVKRVIQATLLVVATTVRGTHYDPRTHSPMHGGTPPGTQRLMARYIPEKGVRQFRGISPRPDKLGGKSSPQPDVVTSPPKAGSDDQKESGPSEVRTVHASGNTPADQTALELYSGSTSTMPTRTRNPPKPRQADYMYEQLYWFTKSHNKSSMIGSGTYGKVYEHEGLCLKMFIHRWERKNPDRIINMIREMWIMTYLRHDNVLSIKKIPELRMVSKKDGGLDLFCHLIQTGGFMYTERMETDLHKWMSKRRSEGTSVAQIMEIAKQLLKGIQYIHSANVMHRDLKAANILINTRDGIHIKIADFGMSRYSVGKDVSLTPKVITKTNRAPEVASFWNGDSRDTYGFESDVWSIGCIIVELLVTTPSRNLERHEPICRFSYFCSPDGSYKRDERECNRIIWEFTEPLRKLDENGRKEFILNWIRKRNKYRQFKGDEENPILLLLARLLDPVVENRIEPWNALYEFFAVEKTKSFDVENADFEIMEKEIKSMLEESEKLVANVMNGKDNETVLAKLLTIIFNNKALPNDRKQNIATNLIFAAKGITRCCENLREYRAYLQSCEDGGNKI